MKQKLIIVCIAFFSFSCQGNHENSNLESNEKAISVAVIKKQLVGDGYEIFDYVDEETKDTIIMQQYFIAFLKRGPNRTQTEEEANLLAGGTFSTFRTYV